MTSDIDSLTDRIEIDPADAWLYHERGWLHGKAKRWKPAFEDFNKAIELKPDEPAFWRDRGWLHEHLGRITLSRNDLDRAVELDPENARSYATRGWCRRLNHDNDGALADLDRAIALKPLEPDHRCRRGLVWLEKRELGKALEDLDWAIRLDPKEARFHEERAKALLYENPDVRPEAALPDLEEAIRLNPDADWYRLHRGYIRFSQGRWAEAAEDLTRQNFRHLYSIAPYLGAERVVWIYLARRFDGQPASGLAAIREYLDWYRDEPEGHMQDQPFPERLQTWPVPLARFLAGDIGEPELFARKDLDVTNPDLIPWDLEGIHERIGECHFVLAELALAQGLPAEALPHLKKASGLPPRNPMSWVVARQLADAARS